MTLSNLPKLGILLASAALGGASAQPEASTAGHIFAFVRVGEPNVLFATREPTATDEQTCFNVAWNELPVPAPGEIAVLGEIVPSALPRCGGRVLLVEEYLTDLSR